MSNSRVLIVLAAGGHARVLVDALTLSGVKVAGVVDADLALQGTSCGGAAVLGTDSELERFPPGSTILVNGLGSAGSMQARRSLFERMRAKGYKFMTVVHPSAILAREAALGEGAQLLAGSIVQPGAAVGENSIVNTGAQIDHDCAIGSHVHVAPGAILSGDVRVGDATHIGVGATVIQGVRIGSGCLVAAGAVVIDDVPDGTRVAGVPARRIAQ